MSGNANSASIWLTFFRGAGIPSGIDKKYALMFDENRIKMDMLMDLNKEYLRDMGILAMGDIIAILKHAKKVNDETKEQAVDPSKSSGASSVSPTPTPQQRNSDKSSVVSIVHKKDLKPLETIKTPTVAGTSSALLAKREAIQKHYAAADNNRSELQVAKSTPKKIVVLKKRPIAPATETKPKEESPAQKKSRLLTAVDKMPPRLLPEGVTKSILQNKLGQRMSLPPRTLAPEKKTVFERLGENSVSSSTEDFRPSSSVGGAKLAESSRAHKSVFDRLGGRHSVVEPPNKTSANTEKAVPVAVEVPRTSNPRPYHQEKTLRTIPSRISIPYLNAKSKLQSKVSAPVTLSSSAASTTRATPSKTSTAGASTTVRSVVIKTKREGNQPKQTDENVVTTHSTLCKDIGKPVKTEFVLPVDDSARSDTRKQEEAKKVMHETVSDGDKSKDRSRKESGRHRRVVRRSRSLSEEEPTVHKKVSGKKGVETVSKSSDNAECDTISKKKFKSTRKNVFESRETNNYSKNSAADALDSRASQTFKKYAKAKTRCMDDSYDSSRTSKSSKKADGAEKRTDKFKHTSDTNPKTKKTDCRDSKRKRKWSGSPLHTKKLCARESGAKDGYFDKHDSGPRTSKNPVDTWRKRHDSHNEREGYASKSIVSRTISEDTMCKLEEVKKLSKRYANVLTRSSDKSSNKKDENVLVHTCQNTKDFKMGSEATSSLARIREDKIVHQGTCENSVSLCLPKSRNTTDSLCSDAAANRTYPSSNTMGFKEDSSTYFKSPQEKVVAQVQTRDLSTESSPRNTSDDIAISKDTFLQTNYLLCNNNEGQNRNIQSGALQDLHYQEKSSSSEKNYYDVERSVQSSRTPNNVYNNGFNFDSKLPQSDCSNLSGNTHFGTMRNDMFATPKAYGISTVSSANFVNAQKVGVVHHYHSNNRRHVPANNNSLYSYENNFVKSTNEVETNEFGEEIVRLCRPTADKDDFVPCSKTFNLMKRMGWIPGDGLGKYNQGRKSAVPVANSVKFGNFGLGYR